MLAGSVSGGRAGGKGGPAAIARADAAGPKMAVGGRPRSSFGMAAPGRGLRLDSVSTGFTLGVCMAQFLVLISSIFEAKGLVNQAGPTPGGDLVRGGRCGDSFTAGCHFGSE